MKNRYSGRFPLLTSLALYLCSSVFIGGSTLRASVSNARADANAISIDNADFEERAADGKPAGMLLSGDVEYRYLGDEKRDISSYGVALKSDRSAGEVSCVVDNIDPKLGRWYRFSFRGLPQANFSVADDELAMTVAFFGEHGKISYDLKSKKIFDQVRDARSDLSINGVRGRGGAEAWRTYQLDFMLPFPQVDQLKLAVSFAHGNAKGAREAQFFVDDFKLERIPEPQRAAIDAPPATQPAALAMFNHLIPLGGRWFYAADKSETVAPKHFDHANAGRLLYHDNVYSAPFADNTSAWLRPGNMDRAGSILTTAKLVEDNVTIDFDSATMIVHSHGVPNHPTGRFPELGFGNPSYIEEQDNTFYLPLDPRENGDHCVTSKDNSNRALHMGPIGVAVNGVVFFNPFDMGNKVAVDMMDRCCGHPNQDGQYHYHKYPICVNTPWADEGTAHSPLLGWAFDGYPVYGPYESKDVMAKDVKGASKNGGALNAFNMHYDEARGWHYHVTPGKFPYLIGGFWGVEDARNDHPPIRGGGGSVGPRDGGPQGGPGEGDRNGRPDPNRPPPTEMRR